jgi:dTDP-4-dehydrorhamnose reductase
MGPRARTVLVTGAGGQLGTDLLVAFAAKGWQTIGTTRAELDVTDRDAVMATVAVELRPDAMVNAAAWTDVDGCERDHDHAWAANALAVRHLAEACAAADAHLCHISTDYVFDGTKAAPYTEWDAPNPQSVYGRSKLGGERELSAGDTVVRTSWLMGATGHNLARTVLRLAADPDRPLAFVDDQRGCPTFTFDLAPMVERLVSDRRPGLFHVTNQEPTTWFGFVQALLTEAGHDRGRVRAITTAELDPPRPAPRPANSVLDNAALRGSGLVLLPSWRESLPALVSSISSQVALEAAR